MSSTNRSRAREAHVSDYYVTPQGTIRDFLKAFNEDTDNLLRLGIDPGPLAILDPCAGGNAKHGMAYPDAIAAYSGWNIGGLTTLDIREDSLASRKEDYLFSKLTDGTATTMFDIAITNPPFNIALDVIQKAMRDVADGGLVIMLLRLNFFGSQERFPFWQGNMPLLTYVHSKRCKFMDTAGTDSIEYIHAVWQVGKSCKTTALRVI